MLTRTQAWLRGAGYALCVSPFASALAYEGHVALWPFEERDFRTSHGDSFVVRCKRRPPPIGLCAYPAGRVLLEWCLLEPIEGRVVEVGSGVGVFAIGYSRARCVEVVASDACRETLKNLERNVRAAEAKVRVAHIDMETASLECDWLCAADIVYATNRPVLPEDWRRHNLRLVLVDRWSGGGFAAIAGGAGIDTSHTEDPSIVQFERAAEAAGLRLRRLHHDDIADLKSRVLATLPLLDRLIWALLGTFGSMRLYEQRLNP